MEFGSFRGDARPVPECLSFVRRLLAAVALLFGVLSASADASLLVPQPRSVSSAAGCRGDITFSRALRLPQGFDAGARELLDERWTALGIPRTAVSRNSDVDVRLERGPHEHYRLRIAPGHKIAIVAAGAEGVFDATMTLAQLARPLHGAYVLPCVQIDDAPALRWRVVSDDVSRGPLPTMRYFKERIRGLAALKINGYSIYMEHVFVDAAHPLVAPAGGITPVQLRELSTYAARFHVALIPEQQTFAHMHGTLRWEEEAPLAELPHGWLLSPANAGTYAYLAPLLREELTASGKVPFVHIGSDEPLDLGRGQSQAMVQAQGVASTFAAHVNRVAQIVRPFGARPMIWDDAVQKDPAILTKIPKNTVVVDFHYGTEKTYLPYIRRVAASGLDQMVSPAAWNWNEFYPLIDAAFDNVARFVADGRQAHVLGMFVTVWHDDGESLYEATWYPLAFAAASAWQDRDVDRSSFARAFSWAFFGSRDARWADSLEHLRALGDRVRGVDPSDYLFWSDPFDVRVGDRVRGAVDVSKLRLDAEAVLNELIDRAPPLHANAARVMELAARRYDVLGRRFQIGVEAKQYYDNARAHLGKGENGIVERGLNLSKYLCWELRDDLLAVERRYRAAWLYESRPAALDGVLAHFHLAEQRAMADADRLNAAEREGYERAKMLPEFEEVIARSRS